MAQAHRIAAFALAARSLGLPLRSMSGDLTSLSDVIGDEHPLDNLLIANLAGEMAVKRFSDYTHYKDVLNGKSIHKMDVTSYWLCRRVMPFLRHVGSDMGAFSRLQDAYVRMTIGLIEHNSDVLETFAHRIFAGLSLAGREAGIMLDAMIEVAWSVTDRMERSKGCPDADISMLLE